MPSIIKFSDTEKVQYNSFDNVFEEEEVVEEVIEEVIVPEEEIMPEPEPEIELPPPIQESDFDVEGFLEKVRLQAEELSKEILDKARAEAEEEAQRMYEKASQAEIEAREQGYKEGYNEGYSTGYVEAYEKGLKSVNQDCDRLLCEIQAGTELFKEEKKMLHDKHLDGMKALTVSIAEKVIGMNLESQSEVIKQMIITALDNSKATKWIKIHISGFDAERYFEIEQELLESVRHISDFVKVEVVEGAEPGTCIIEMPDKIIDASINTQISNIKGMLDN